MRKVGLFSLGIGLVSLVATPVWAADCTCADAKTKNGWCAQHNTGFFAGTQVATKEVYDALQGKDPSAATAKCAGCKDALAHEGMCDKCHVGFAHSKMYASPVAYHLAVGEITDPAKVTCPTCKKNAAGKGWCSSCNTGMVGPMSYDEQAVYDAAVKASEILASALQTASKCAPCAVAMVTDGTCAKCNITYKNGKKKTEIKGG